jgi:uncharacterized protein (TIGR01244 family)
MNRTKKITKDVSVSTFLTPEELPALANEFRTIINNRPDGEEPGQATSAELESAARKLGVDYVHIPVVPGQISDEQVAAFAKALAEKPGAKLAFCRSGTRSATLWALSQAGARTATDILAATAGAGYDLRSLAPRLQQRTQTK